MSARGMAYADFHTDIPCRLRKLLRRWLRVAGHQKRVGSTSFQAPSRSDPLCHREEPRLSTPSKARQPHNRPVIRRLNLCNLCNTSKFMMVLFTSFVFAFCGVQSLGSSSWTDYVQQRNPPPNRTSRDYDQILAGANGSECRNPLGRGDGPIPRALP